MREFQSLLQWIGLINCKSVFAKEVAVITFQSLLQWIGLINPVMVGSASRMAPSFNPCCSGSGSSTRTPPRPACRPRGFNPCCSGSGSSTGDPPWIDRGLAEFQSLLQWIGLINAHQLHGEPTDLIVSILVAVDRAHQLGVAGLRRGQGVGVSILVAVDRAHQLRTAWSMS